MTKRGMKWAGAVVGVMIAMTAWAGNKVNQPVTIMSFAGGITVAGGPLGSVRNSTHTGEAISCSVSTNASSPSGGDFGYCHALDQYNTFGSCTTTDPRLVAAIRSIKGDSLLEFTWNSSGTCIAIRVEESSVHAPKVL